MVGRFAYKVWDKRRTVYLITDRRALVLRGRLARAVPLDDRPFRTWLTGDGRHLCVQFALDGSTQRWLLGMDLGLYDNSGLDFLAGRRPLSFYDVADVAGLRAALEQV